MGVAMSKDSYHLERTKRFWAAMRGDLVPEKSQALIAAEGEEFTEEEKSCQAMLAELCRRFRDLPREPTDYPDEEYWRELFEYEEATRTMFRLLSFRSNRRAYPDYWRENYIWHAQEDSINAQEKQRVAKCIGK